MIPLSRGKFLHVNGGVTNIFPAKQNRLVFLCALNTWVSKENYPNLDFFITLPLSVPDWTPSLMTSQCCHAILHSKNLTAARCDGQFSIVDVLSPLLSVTWLTRRRVSTDILQVSGFQFSEGLKSSSRNSCTFTLTLHRVLVHMVKPHHRCIKTESNQFLRITFTFRPWFLIS